LLMFIESTVDELNMSIEHCWNDTDRRKQKYSEKILFQRCLPTTHTAQTDLGMKFVLSA
jgi:hypothetical protein